MKVKATIISMHVDLARTYLYPIFEMEKQNDKYLHYII